jgi:hypothetical protein
MDDLWGFFVPIDSSIDTAPRAQCDWPAVVIGRAPNLRQILKTGSHEGGPRVTVMPAERTRLCAAVAASDTLHHRWLDGHRRRHVNDFVTEVVDLNVRSA